MHVSRNFRSPMGDPKYPLMLDAQLWDFGIHMGGTIEIPRLLLLSFYAPSNHVQQYRFFP